MNRIGVLAALLAWSLVTATAHAQTGFSADLVDLKRRGTPVEAKVYFSDERMRIQPQNMTPSNAPPIVFMIYLKTQTSFAILPQQRVYAQIPPQENWLMYTYFLSGNIEDACGGWDKISHRHSSTCHKIGDENVNGRPSVKYEARCSNNEPCHIWVDRELHFLVKWEDRSAGKELRNIQEGPQPSALFTIPKGFTKQQAQTGIAHSAISH